jgi:DNA primase small subunit
MEDIILQYTYPRLDAEVSKHRNHLLKAPFCVHPATGISTLTNLNLFLMENICIGRICVPVNPSEVGEFDPEAVPTVGQLLRELDEQAVDVGDERAGSYHSNTM